MKILKSILLSAAVVLILYACTNDNETRNDSKNIQTKLDSGLIPTNVVNNPVSKNDTTLRDKKIPVISFKNKNYDFGVLIEGEKVSHVFKFKNTGTADLVITKVSSSCGCTVVDFSNAPVPPGGEGKIEVVFNSAGTRGYQHKKIRVLANTIPNLTELSVTAQVLGPDEINR